MQQLQPNFDVCLNEAVLDTFKRNLTSIAQGFINGYHMCKNTYITYIAAELSSFTPDAILTDAAKYFQMTEQAALASNLTGYLTVASEPLSIVLCTCMHVCVVVLQYETVCNW